MASLAVEVPEIHGHAAGLEIPKRLPRERGRVPELDGIRGIAILLVLFWHGFGWPMRHGRWTGIPRWVEIASRPGWMGVDLFFVLSGFLITGILLDSAGKPRCIRNFYGRRALRILPLYYLTLILIAICYRGSLSFVGISTVYLANMAPIFGVPFLYPPLWSLSVEEHFYLLWPWLVSSLKPRRIWLLAAGICLAEPALRVIAFFHGWGVYYYSWFRFDGLAAGALLALFVRSGHSSKERLNELGLICVVLAGLMASVMAASAVMGTALLFSFSTLLATWLLSLVLSGSFRPLMVLTRSRWLRKFGDWSYFLYIIHWLIFYGWDSAIGMYPAPLVADLGRFGAICIRALAVYAACCILAELSRRYFEGPLLRLKRRFAYAPSGQPQLGMTLVA